MVNNHYRWDFIGLSTDTKPTPETSEKVVNGSTFYTSDDSKLYVWCDGEWYEKVVSGGGGGTSNFNQLTNRPKYNGTTMTGETNIPEVINSAFTGTDGTAAGTAGLVPAPATTDAGKFLKADGNWSEISGGSGVVQLTSADYDYPTDSPNGVALWRLSPGLYNWDNGVRVYTSASYSNTNGASAFVTEAAGNAREYVEVLRFYPGGANNTYNWTKVNYNTGAVVNSIDNAHLLSDKSVVQTTGTSTTDVMSQKAVTDMVFANDSANKVRIGTSASTHSGNGSSIAIGTNASATSTNNTAIGVSATASGSYSLAVGLDTVASNNNAVALGRQANASGQNSIAIGWNATATQQGQFDISTGTNQTAGYNSSNYRLLTGLYDPQSAHDAATKGYVDTVIAALEARVAALEGN